MPSRRLVIGPVDAPILTFENPTLRAVADESAVSLIGKQLSVDMLGPLVDYVLYVDYELRSSDDFVLISSDGYELRPYANYDLRRLPYGTKLTYYVDDRIQGEFYSKKVKQKGKSLFEIPAESEIGLMSSQRSLGGMYTGQSFAEVLAELLGEGANYSITEDAAAIRVYGYMPAASRRENLHLLTTSYGVNILRSDAGGMLFTILGNSAPDVIDEDVIYNEGDVDFGDPASRVEVTEHAYFYLDNVDEETVFDNTKSDAVTSSLIKFKQPIYPDSLRCSEGTLSIEAAGVNYAVVSGVGILVGKPYTHTTRIVARDNPNALTENVKRLPNATLVTVANSDNVLLRLSEFYFNATTFNSSIKLGNEKCGRRYVLHNAFGEKRTAFLSKISAAASSITKAQCEFIADYIPRAQGSTYSNVVILPDASGIWTVPQEVKDKDIPNIRAVLIGIGETGSPGTAGTKGETASTSSGGKGGKGGEGGAGGKGGKIYSITIDCTDIVNFAYGRTGVNTWLKGGGHDLSSANGASSSSGFLEQFSGTVYALPGRAGQPGGAGGKGGVYKHTGKTSPADGESVQHNGRTYAGGKAGNFVITVIRKESNDGYGGPGGGGGAAVGSNGGRGGEGYWDAVGGTGANGAAGDPAAAVYGSGGNGGHGGGGGGGGGLCENWNWLYNSVVGIGQRAGGSGGSGGAGSAGYQGCVIIYY